MIEGKMLKITGHTGFHLTLKNGWTASVQFGPGSYTSSHHNTWDFEAPKNADRWESFDAEVAVWHSENGKDGPLESFGNDNVKGWLNADQVLSFLNWCAGEEHDVSELNQLLKKDEN